MTAKEIAAAAALAAAVLVVGAVIVRGDEKPIDAKDTVIEPSKAALDIDGGVAYLQRVKTEDGGIEMRRVAPTHKRRPRGIINCTFPDGGLPGENNRYDNLIGAGCEAVAGSVSYGENSELPEKDIVGASK